MRNHSIWVGLAIVSAFLAWLAVDAPLLVSYQGTLTDGNVSSSLDAVAKQYPCGDANGDSCVTFLDVAYILDLVYHGGPPPIGDADVNLDGRVTIGDASYLIAYLYRGGTPPCGVEPPLCPPPAAWPDDTVEMGYVTICCTSTIVSVPIILKNSSTVIGMTFALEYDTTLVTCDSAEFDPALFQDWWMESSQDFSATILKAVFTPSLIGDYQKSLSPGTHEVATLWFSSLVDSMLAEDTVSPMDTVFILPSNYFCLVDTSQTRLTPTISMGGFDIQSHCGDANGDGCQFGITVADAVYLSSYCYRDGPAPVCHADVNLDSRLTIADAIYVTGYIYRSGPPPCEPTR